MDQDWIRVDALKSVTFLRRNDLYDLARLVLGLNEAKNKGTTTRSYQTVHGLAGSYATLIDVPREEVEAVLNEAGFRSGATIVNVNDVMPRVDIMCEQVDGGDGSTRA